MPEPHLATLSPKALCWGLWGGLDPEPQCLGKPRHCESLSQPDPLPRQGVWVRYSTVNNGEEKVKFQSWYAELPLSPGMFAYLGLAIWEKGRQMKSQALSSRQKGLEEGERIFLCRTRACISGSCSWRAARPQLVKWAWLRSHKTLLMDSEV